MFRNRFIVSVFISALIVPGLAFGRTPANVSPDDIAKLKDEGMNRSQAMATIRYLTDVIGPRLTNSPNQRRANQWTKEQLEKWGLKNAMVDPWGEFGRGWEIKRFGASYSTAGENGPFRAFPKACRSLAKFPARARNRSDTTGRANRPSREALLRPRAPAAPGNVPGRSRTR